MFFQHLVTRNSYLILGMFYLSISFWSKSLNLNWLLGSVRVNVLIFIEGVLPLFLGLNFESSISSMFLLISCSMNLVSDDYVSGDPILLYLLRLLFRCTNKLYFLENGLSQWAQVYFIFPTWIICICLSKLPFCENFISHWEHS